jgi:hypothetical protein
MESVGRKLNRRDLIAGPKIGTECIDIVVIRSDNAREASEPGTEQSLDNGVPLGPGTIIKTFDSVGSGQHTRTELDCWQRRQKRKHPVNEIDRRRRVTIMVHVVRLRYKVGESMVNKAGTGRIMMSRRSVLKARRLWDDS